jgi:hypothetical protein
MKYLKKYKLIKESKDIVQRQFKFGDMVMDLIIKENPIVHDVDDVMNEINDILGHDVVPIYGVYIFHGGNHISGFDIHQKEWWDYMNMDEGDFDDLKKDLKDAQKDLIKIRNGEYSDVKLEVNYQYANASNNFESIQMTEELDKAIKQVRKHLTNIGCEIQEEGMSDKFWGLKITFPIKLSQSNNLDVTLDGLPENVIKDFNQFIMDYKIDDEGKIRLSNLIRKAR